MRRIIPLAALAAAVVAVPVVVAQNAPTVPGAPDKARVAAGTYAADAGHTMVVWTVDHFGFSDYTGIFGDVTGTLVIDPESCPGKSRCDDPHAKVTPPAAA